MSNRPKDVLAGYRITTGGSNILEDLSAACDNYNISLNGSGKVTASALLTFLWEHAAESQTKTQALENILTMIDLKDKSGKPINPILRKIIITEVTNGDYRR